MRRLWAILCGTAMAGIFCLKISEQTACAQRPIPTILREQRFIESRDRASLPKYTLPDSQAVRTVSQPPPQPLEPIKLSLDQAIRTALQNADVIRILAGNTAVSSGQTVYDPGVVNTGIDQQQGRFDPTLSISNSWNRVVTPNAEFDPLDPQNALINSLRSQNYNLNANINKTNAYGGVTSFGATTNPTTLQPGIFPLNPQNNPTLQMGYTQPLLKGGGLAANMAPIVIARINTERSYYQLKDSVLDQVRGVIEGYWALVFARVDYWVKQRQVEQTEEALKLAEGRFRSGIADVGEVAQARTSLGTFMSNRVAAEANMLQREAALRNLLGMPPSDGTELIPTTPLRDERYQGDWDMLRELAAENRPDLLNLQLTLEADENQLAQLRNFALPEVNGVALYRWKGLGGTQPNGTNIDPVIGQYNDWTMGVNVDFPLGLRQPRASFRQQELIVARDRANLHQGLHAASHQLATTVRSIDQQFEQYVTLAEARRAARLNLERQLALYSVGRTIYLNVLQAITDWGNILTSEANSLTQFNSQLGNLERQTGTILETHGVFFFEEQYRSLGPFDPSGRFFRGRDYPEALRQAKVEDQYPASDKRSEEDFELDQPGRPEFDSPLPDLPYEELLPKDREKLRQPPEQLPAPAQEPVPPAENSNEPKPETSARRSSSGIQQVGWETPATSSPKNSPSPIRRMNAVRTSTVKPIAKPAVKPALKGNGKAGWATLGDTPASSPQGRTRP